MITTIDKAGRVVIPKALRQRFHLGPDTQLELIPDGDGIRLRVPKREAVFVEKAGVLVQQADTPAAIDATAFINAHREARSLHSIDGPQRR